MENTNCLSASRLFRFFSLLACLALSGPTFADCNVKQDMLGILNALDTVYGRLPAIPEREAGKAAVDIARNTVSNIPDALLTPFNNVLCPLLLAQKAQAEALVAELKGTPFDGLVGEDLGTPLIRDQIPPFCALFPHGSNLMLTASLLTGSIKAMTDTTLATACNQDILGENFAAACVPISLFGSAGQILSQFITDCYNADSSANIEFIGNTLLKTTKTIGDIGQGVGGIKPAIDSVIATVNASTTSIIANSNANKTEIIANDNANTAKIINELQTLACELDRILHMPNGQRSSSLPSCSGKPGFPYKWNQSYPY